MVSQVLIVYQKYGSFFSLCIFFSSTTFNSLQICLRWEAKQLKIVGCCCDEFVCNFHGILRWSGIWMTLLQCDLSICTNVWTKDSLKNPHNSNTNGEYCLFRPFRCVWYSYPIGMNDVSQRIHILRRWDDLFVCEMWMILWCGVVCIYADILCTLHVNTPHFLPQLCISALRI